jgi:mRNA-degrading endonuclease toxin of MazEF toxin-antitoxin module
MKIERGDIFFADLSPVIGSEIGGMRYVVVVQNNELNDEVSSNGCTVIVAPLFSNSMDVGTKNARAMMPADIPELSFFCITFCSLE